MSAPVDNQNITRTFWIISIIALVWNLIGVMTYLMTVMVSPEALDAMTDAERILYTDTPAWVTSAYAIAVFGGTLASIFLLMKKAWAVPVFTVSLIGILLQMGHGFFMTNMLEVRGSAAAILPILIIVVAVFLVWFSQSAKKKGWINN